VLEEKPLLRVHCRRFGWGSYESDIVKEIGPGEEAAVPHATRHRLLRGRLRMRVPPRRRHLTNVVDGAQHHSARSVQSAPPCRQTSDQAANDYIGRRQTANAQGVASCLLKWWDITRWCFRWLEQQRELTRCWMVEYERGWQ
jgi:hypothetical protein